MPKKLKKSNNLADSVSIYAEAESDDEFAQCHLILPSETESGSDTDCEREADESTVKSDEPEYRIQYLLGRKALTPRDWRKICDAMNTLEVKRGSLLVQPDEEYFDETDVLIEKFLVKWEHASFLHCSWETESDLKELAGVTSSKNHVKKCKERELHRIELFEDLGKGEYFPPQFLEVERILDVDDEYIESPLDINFKTAMIPSLNGASDLPTEEEEKLHGDSCFLTVKWGGMPYVEISQESVADLQLAGIDYEFPLREYFRREQLPPVTTERRRVERTLNSTAYEQSDVMVMKGGELRSYQWEGVRWLLFNWSQKRNSILADEMGLGKTIQTAAFLQMLKSFQGVRGPFLIVAPLSTVVNWQRELQTWTDLDVVLYNGTHADRKLIRQYDFTYGGDKKKGCKLEILVTSPETCMTFDDKSSGRREIAKIFWEMIVIDEAHKMKNHDSKLSTALRENFQYRNSLLLTGTPLQNNTDELWSLLHFVDRERFCDREGFVEKYGSLKTAQQLEDLQRDLRPYLLRREKEHVERSVPPKEELIVEVELTVPQKQYYRAIYEQNTRFLYRGGGGKDGPRLCNLAMEVRKCCNHPYLIKGAKNALAAHFENEDTQEIMVKASGKMMLLDKLLPKLQKDGHRVLIFSQFRIMLDIIEDLLNHRGFTYERVDGSITGKRRQAAIDRYSAEGCNTFVMLLSTRAGGVGINLTAADTVIIYDSDWNPQNDLQAQARAHRIGQTKGVKVYRLLTRKTYEMIMFKTASMKLGLDYAVMHNLNHASSVLLDSAADSIAELPLDSGAKQHRGKRGKHSKAGNSSESIEGVSAERVESMAALSKRELENMLKHGAYDIFREGKDGMGDEESVRFAEADIDQILERAAVVMHDSRGKSAVAKVSSSFSKASFVTTSSEGEQNDIALDDPDFWSKVVGLACKEEEQSNSRKRKCALEVSSYKEPSDSIRNLLSTEIDSEDGDTKKRSKQEDESTIVEADWAPERMQRLLLALLKKGYGNWQTISLECRLRWSEDDIARGCRLLTLLLLKWSSLRRGGSANDLDADSLEDYLSNHRLARVALRCFSRDSFNPWSPCPASHVEYSASLIEKNLMKEMRDSLAGRNALEISQIHACFDQKDHGISLQSLTEIDVTSLLKSLAAPDDLLLSASPEDTDDVRTGKLKTFAKSRLAQLDDLYELSIFPLLLSPEFDSKNNDSDGAASEQIPVLNKLKDLVAPNASQMKCLDERWTEFHDAVLFISAEKIGWPEGKRQLAALIELAVKSVGGETAEQESLEAIFEPKHVLKRAKEWAAFLRPKSKSEQIKEASAARAAEVAAGQREAKKFTQSFLTSLCRLGRPRTVYNEMLASCANPELEELKLGVLTWEQLAAEVQSLMNATGMQAEVNDAFLGRLKTAMEELFKAWESDHQVSSSVEENLTEQPDKAKKVVAIGMFAGLLMRQIDQVVERCNFLHRTRLAYLYHILNKQEEPFAFVKGSIRRNCKAAGPSVPKPKRDLTLPVWWTVQLDIQLLIEILKEARPLVASCTTEEDSGGGDAIETEVNCENNDSPRASSAKIPSISEAISSAWKSIALKQSLQRPLSFVMPPKQQGVEWVNELTFRIAEKRSMTILNAPQVVPSAMNLPFGSPEKVRPEKVGSVAAKKSTSLQPSLVGVRPSWVTSMIASAGRPKPLSTSSPVSVSQSEESNQDVKNCVESIAVVVVTPELSSETTCTTDPNAQAGIDSKTTVSSPSTNCTDVIDISDEPLLAASLQPSASIQQVTPTVSTAASNGSFAGHKRELSQPATRDVKSSKKAKSAPSKPTVNIVSFFHQKPKKPSDNEAPIELN